ncbi:glycoside hydrolase family 88/105 protein [Persicirhabdus sediminis]|uniref:Glycoside hydrolase family 88 protein n=1 Tax=Persicirhabdus sediminis TaxID=454144 RepID=A0A8J7MGM6_9BACT|nr:glycoside hydrolase family 88 protein [Persicirhabdus sediminis]MBK1792443.1 glycoside hydrolase family 88 protein [Persicirhabdus sediminis]
MLKPILTHLITAGIATLGLHAAEPATAESTLAAMNKVANKQLDDFQKKCKADWINATAFAGLAELYHLTEDPEQGKKLIEIGEKNNWDFEHGLKRQPYHADHLAHGQFDLAMYAHFKKPEMLATIKKRIDHVVDNPSSCGLTHDKKANKERWNWCDALFMAPPVLTRMYVTTGDSKYLDFLDKEFWATWDYLYRPEYKLIYRDDRYFEQKSKNGKDVFWGRGDGWVHGGLARVIELYPADRPAKEKYIKAFQDLSAGILAVRNPDGLWSASLLDPEDVTGNEMSATAFFCYGFAWGVNHGYLDKETYWPVALETWNRMQEYVTDDGRYIGVQQVGDKPVDFKANTSKPYGTGAFLLAGSEIYQGLSGKKLDKNKIYAGK